MRLKHPSGVRWLGALAFALALTVSGASGAGVFPYDMVFVPPTPLPPLVPEGTTVTIGIELQGGCDPFSTILWQVAAETGPGTATPGMDFQQPNPAALPFNGPNGRFMTTDLTIPDDLEFEGLETFDLVLRPMGPAQLDCGPVGPTQPEYRLTITILDDDPPPQPSLRIGDVELVEGDAGTSLAVFPVTLEGLPGGTVTVGFRTNDGTASASSGDYVSQNGTLLFAAGSIGRGAEVQNVSVPVNGDLEVEPDETFFVQLLMPTGAMLDDDVGQAIIRNDDQPPPELPTVSIDDTTVDEGDEGTGGTARFMVTLSAPAEGPVSVPFATADGSALADEDYQALEGTLSFSPGQTMMPLDVPVIGDTTFEGDETFLVRLGPPMGATIDDGEGEATIVDDDPEPPTPMLAVGDAAVDEGDQGTTNAVFTVRLAPASDVEVEVAATTRGGSATPGVDFVAREQVLTIAAGQTTATFAVPVIGDLIPENDETFFVDLSDATGAAIEDGEGRGLIRDDDQPPATPPVLSIGDTRRVEGDAGLVAAIFPVRLSQPSNLPVAVDAGTVDGTATAAADYRPRADRLVFAPGQVELAFAVPVVGDRIVEGDEVFGVELANPAGAVLGDAQGVGTIIDDDRPTSLVRLVPSPPVAESDGRATVEVERVGDATAAAEAVVATTAGSAQAGADFTAVRRRVRWAAGESGRREITFAVRDDQQVEDDETVVVRLLEPQGARLGSPDRLDLVIVDDDAAARAEAIDEQQITAIARRVIELSVRTVREDGTPVPGAPVRWRIVAGQAEILGETEQRTDDEGVTRQRVRLGRRPGRVVVAVELVGRESEVAFEIRVDGDLGDLVDPGAEPNEAGLAGLLDAACGDQTEGDLGQLCAFLFDLDDGQRRLVLAALRPDGAAALADRGLRTPRIQSRNIGARLRALRGTPGKLATDQLSINLRGRSLDVGSLRRAWAQPHDDQRWLAGIASALASVGDSDRTSTVDDDATERASAMDESAADTAGDRAQGFDYGASRWGVFVNGRIAIGDAARTALQPGYDFETEGLTGGFDVRLSERLVVGGALGYARTDTELGRRRGDIDATGWSLSGYFTYFRERFYLDGIVSHGWNDYASRRVIDLPVPFLGSDRLVAQADPDGRQLGVEAGTGYALLDGGPLSLDVFGRLAYTRARVDAYRERGAGPFGLAVDDQELESVVAEAGLELAYPWSFRWGVLQPSLRVALLEELADDSRALDVGLTADLARRRYLELTDEPDRSYFNLGAALTATLVRGWAAYLQYDTDVARDDFDIYTVSVGVRKQL